jgi:ATP-dependent DNA helicase UvrD/PcrA
MDSSSTALHPAESTSFAEVLNEPQLAAVTHPAGPLLVLAGAGSGKTRVITYRIAHLVAVHRIPPYRILAVTFTNKAAKEMRTRIERLVGPEIAADLWVGTFHATCARMLRRYHDAVGLARDFVIYDDSDQRALMNRVVKALKLDDRQYPPKLLLSAIHGHKQHGTQPDEIPTDTPMDKILAQVFAAYQRQLLAANAVDFDDLIIHITRLAEDPSSVAGAELQRRFEFVLVDEFQDVNPIQYRLVRAMVSAHHNVCVVGDDDQSIYRWRGADVRIIRGFKNDFPGTRVVKLEQNYRSTSNVVRAALGVIKPSREREAKELFTKNDAGAPVRIVATRDERDEAAFVVSTIRKALDEGVDAKQIAVFYRIHAQSRVLEEGMRSENVPYQIIGGTRFFDRAEVKDIIAYLRVVANPASDVDLLRIINVPARKIGNATIEKLIETANVTSRSIYEVITGDLRLTGLKAGPRKRVAAFATMMAGFRAFASELGPRAMAERVLEITGYANALARENTAEADARLENLQELLGSLEEYEDEAVAAGTSPSLSDYLERVSLVSDVDQVQNVPRVSMMTIHGAKGLEFEVVLVTGAEEELFPYRSSKVMQEPGQLEEERRLAYVAFTRAREHLFITHAGSRMIFGTTRYTRPSRFLADLPPDVIDQQLSPALGRLRAPMSSPGRLWESQPEEPRYAPGERFVELDENPCPPDDVPLTRGTLVVHRKYGEGRVEAVELSQTPPIAVVFFPGWGKKKIVVSFLQPA